MSYSDNLRICTKGALLRKDPLLLRCDHLPISLYSVSRQSLQSSPQAASCVCPGAHLYSVVLEAFLVPGISSPFFTQ